MPDAIYLPLGILSILTNIFILLYLGTTFDDKKNIDPNDWKKKWIIFFAWLDLALVGLAFAIVLFALVMAGVRNVREHTY